MNTVGMINSLVDGISSTAVTIRAGGPPNPYWVHHFTQWWSMVLHVVSKLDVQFSTEQPNFDTSLSFRKPNSFPWILIPWIKYFTCNIWTTLTWNAVMNCQQQWKGVCWFTNLEIYNARNDTTLAGQLHFDKDNIVLHVSFPLDVATRWGCWSLNFYTLGHACCLTHLSQFVNSLEDM